MDVAGLIQSYGYLALAVGTLLEGEIILIAAGFAAHRGYLDISAVIGIAALCGFLGDQFFFWLGRRHGPAVLKRWPSVSLQSDRVHRLIERYHAPVIIGVRFAYGLRIAGPILIGMSPISGVRFMLLNGMGAILWAMLIASVGWLFGQAAAALFDKIEHIEGWLLLGLLAAGGTIWLIRKLREG
jgi:membrane protein DedA with SNARE-associated domain